jgi:hypothetical protein
MQTDQLETTSDHARGSLHAKPRLPLLICAAVLWLGAGPANAQVLCGSLTGSVTVTSQALVPGATVRILNLATGVVIEANRVRRFDATLKVAQMTESVIVTAGAEQLQTDRADVNVSVTSRQTTNLPLGGSMGRNFQSSNRFPTKLLYGLAPYSERKGKR